MYRYDFRDMTLDFIWDEVIPAVLGELQLELGEVSINGFRYRLD